MTRAWALAVYAGQCFFPVLDGAGWKPSWTDKAHPEARAWGNVPRRVSGLAGRLAGVAVENRDAVDLLAYEVRRPDVVIYCDPPYGAGSAATSAQAYRGGVDRAAMLDVLRGAAAQVAVGGYPGDTWEALEDDGWHRAEKRLLSSMASKRGDPHRTEVLWTNYPPLRPTLL